MKISKKNLKPHQIDLIKNLLYVYQFYYSYHITPLCYQCIYFDGLRYVILTSHVYEVLKFINLLKGVGNNGN